MTQIADAPDALTPGWLTRVLSSSGHLGAGATVTGVERSPIGTGQMCDSLRLRLTVEGDSSLPPTIVAKIPAADETSRSTALALRSYEIEVRFYQQLATQLDIRTPEVFHADIDVGSASFVLLLEDLAPAEQGDQLEGCTVDAARVAVRELVGLHAPRWGDPALGDVDWLHRDPEGSRVLLRSMLPNFWDGFRARYDDRISEDVRTAGGELIDRLETFLGTDTRPWTVVHGDYRLDNLLFAPDNSSVTTVDWQTCAHGPALGDVAYLLGGGLREADRRAVEEDLVADYHAALLAAGVEDYPWERCWTDYRRGSWSGLIMAVGASMLVERTARGDDMFVTMANRHARHVVDSDAVDLLG